MPRAITARKPSKPSKPSKPKAPKAPPRYEVFAGEVAAALATLLPEMQPPLCLDDLLDLTDEASLVALLRRRGVQPIQPIQTLPRPNELELLHYLLKRVSMWQSAQWMKAHGYGEGREHYLLGWR